MSLADARRFLSQLRTHQGAFRRLAHISRNSGKTLVYLDSREKQALKYLLRRLDMRKIKSTSCS